MGGSKNRWRQAETGEGQLKQVAAVKTGGGGRDSWRAAKMGGGQQKQFDPMKMEP